MGLTVCLTHDVDRVYKTHQYLTRDLRGGHLSRLRTLFTGASPFWRFEPLMEVEDRHAARSTYFFLEESIPFEPLRPARWKLSLGRYSYADRRVAEIVRRLDAGGWDIGVHGSYNSFRDGELLRREKASLEAVLGRPTTGIRQHYLNLDVPGTWILQRDAGFRYDASLGRRSGIGFPQGRYRPFVDPASGMLVIPLAMMESYLFREAGGSLERAWSLTLQLMDEAEREDAVFTVLWHPHVYNDAEFPGFATLYDRLLGEARARGARFLTCQEVFEAYGPGAGLAPGAGPPTAARSDVES